MTDLELSCQSANGKNNHMEERVREQSTEEIRSFLLALVDAHSSSSLSVLVHIGTGVFLCVCCCTHRFGGQILPPLEKGSRRRDRT